MKIVVLPLLLAAVQLVWWPLGLLRGEPPVDGAWAASVGVLATLLVAFALTWRRSRPVASLAGVTAGLTVALVGTPADASLVIAVADLVALYSVAAHRPRRTWAWAIGLLSVWQIVVSAVEYGISGQWAVESGFTVLLYLVVAGGGVARQQWRAGRQAAADALRQAQTAHREAGSGERQRLSAELHDLSAHHLTSIVVSMNAARRLRTSRPELLAESLDLAACTGREALKDLRGLLAEAGPAPTGTGVAERLAELTDAFTRLGQRVTVEAPDLTTLSPQVAEAAHAIVREALTNTLRYAPGAAVRVRLSLPATAQIDAGQLSIAVENDAVAGDGAASRLGSGRGLAGLRRRVAALGGSLTAGAAPEGGWRVSATLPAGGHVVAGSARWWSAHRTPLIDVALVVLLLALSTAGLLVREDDSWTPRPVPLGGWPFLLLAVHALPLLGRRRSPWLAWAGVFATVGLWPLWLTAAGVTDQIASAMVFAAGTEIVAIYTVGAHARHRWPSLLVIPASVAALLVAFGAETASNGWTVDGEPASLAAVLVGGVVMGVLLGVPCTLIWAAGFAVRLRRDGVVRREHHAVGAVVAAAESEARAERARLVGGLRAQVLEHTERVVAAAEAGDPDEVLAAARAALAAMRELLTALDPPASAVTAVTVETGARGLAGASPGGSERAGTAVAST